MYFSRRGPEAGLLLQGEPRQKLDQVGAGELPLERPSHLLVAGLEGQDALAEVVERGGIAGSQHLALQDREVDLDLVDPACVDRQVDDNEVGIGSLEEPLAEFPELGTALAGPYEGKRRLVVGRFNVVYEHDRTADQVGIIFIVFSGLR